MHPDARIGNPWAVVELSTPEALVASEVERLQRRKREALDELDRFERESAMMGVGIETAPAMRRLRREESACFRRFEWARRELVGPTTATGSTSLAAPAAISRLVPEPRRARGAALPEPAEEDELAFERKLYQAFLDKGQVPPESLTQLVTGTEPGPLTSSSPVSTPPTPSPLPPPPLPGNRKARRAALKKARSRR